MKNKKKWKANPPKNPARHSNVAHGGAGINWYPNLIDREQYLRDIKKDFGVRDIPQSSKRKIFEMIALNKEDLKNSKTYLRFGGLLLAIAIIIPLLMSGLLLFAIFLLIIGVIFFLYGLRGIISHIPYPSKLKDVLIISTGCIIAFISIPYLYYGSIGLDLCDINTICPLPPKISIGVGISLLICGLFVFGFGFIRLRTKAIAEYTSNSDQEF